MSETFDPIQYKINSKTNWNTVAPDYHYNWADKQVGPFKSTFEVVKTAKIRPGDKVLDLACGTGVVSKEISRYLDKNGFLIGVDLSRTALSIAKKSVPSSNSLFLEMDVENMGFNFTFDKIVCQYGLMFFPNVNQVLQSVKKTLRKDGIISIAVHGLPEEVPYFSSIMEPVVKYIPDIRPAGTPTVHRFGDQAILKKELTDGGFSDVSIKKFTFSYEPGTFEEYWDDYMHSTANSIRSRIENAGPDILSKIKTESRQNVSKYEKDGKIIFPWSVLVANAA